MSALEELFSAIVNLEQRGDELARKALEEGVPPLAILNQGVAPAMAVVGQKMESGEFFVPDVLLAARVAQRAAAVVKPFLKRSDSVTAAGTVVIGTVEDDLHSIGKDLVKMLLEASGFLVIDLGVNVPPHAFVAAATEHRADIVAMSALLNTTTPGMQSVIEALTGNQLRDRVKVLVGGAPVTPEFATAIGADGYGSTAAAGARLAAEWAAARDANDFGQGRLDI